MDGVIEQLGKVLVQGAVAILVSIPCEVEIARHEPVAINMAGNFNPILKEMLRVRVVGRSVNIGDGESGIRGFTYEEEC